MSNEGSDNPLDRALALDRQLVWMGVAYLAVGLARVALRFLVPPSPVGGAPMWTDILLGKALLVFYVLMAVVLWRAVAWLGFRPTVIPLVFVGLPVLGMAFLLLARVLRSPFPRATAALRLLVPIGIVVGVAATWLYVKRLLSSRIEELRRLSP